ncbi:hypothetical protein B0H12DRAFT_1018742 [Mycena haematopus]|nr:hypothetical protein B0H12DRAFT_1018742 [Mycena haematopus]
MLRRDGLGDDISNLACGCCSATDKRIFRCVQCGEFLQCRDCVLERHALNPLHTLKEWNGRFWTEAQLCGKEELGALGLVYQLGHHGFRCTFPGPRRVMVVIHVSGIYTVEFQYCGCDRNRRTSNLGQLLRNAWYPATTVDPGTCATFEVLEQFRLLNVVGNVNVYDFVVTLERLTDPLKLSAVPDRYKAFSRMARQYAFLLRAKRAGRGHEPDGLSKTKPGGLAVLCWACPHDGKNLPEGWKDVDPRYRFLYMLLLALDANFRLKNRLRANEHQDPSLGSGLGYFVEDTAYKEHLKNYVAESDVRGVSTCIAFAALLQKETRLTTGLRCSGVGGCVCARHGVVRPQGLGDLQKGEQYANMDFIALASLLGVTLILLMISYDIACQWKVHFLERAKKIKSTTWPGAPAIDSLEIQYALPVWHAGAHETICQTENSLSYAGGVGRTDGEGIERTWAVLNPIGFATKEMGSGARHDAIENKVDHMNWEKNLGQGDTLARKLIVAIAERDKQAADFAEVDRTLSSRLRKEWQKKIDTWTEDRSQPNPYCLAGAGPSEAAVFLELKNAEAAEAAEGRAPIMTTTTTASAFIKAGLQLEEAQRRIKAELKGTTLVTADRASQIQELRISLLRKLKTFERLQSTYMPGVVALREEAENLRDPEIPPPKVEDIKLWMPSELSDTARRAACSRGLSEIEAKVRRGQCQDALDNLRSRLHSQSHLIMWRNSNSTGQRAATRSATLIGRVGDRIGRIAAKYRHARAALMALKGPDFAPQFKELRESDLTTTLEAESDEVARRKLNRLGSSKRARNEPSIKKATMSWIWTAGGGPGEDEEQLCEGKWSEIAVRVEWSKTKARRDRWEEEVMILREEMRRVLRMLRWTRDEWERRAALHENVDAAVAAGLKAYAACQVYVHRRIGEGFHTGWSRSVATAVRDVMRQDGTVYRDLLEGVADDEPALGLEGVEEAVAEEGTAG